jgi:hypothetical protein
MIIMRKRLYDAIMPQQRVWYQNLLVVLIRNGLVSVQSETASCCSYVLYFSEVRVLISPVVAGM